MAAVNITSVHVLDNPSQFTNPLQFEIQYECLYRLEGDLEWKLVYVGCAEDNSKDQVLDEVLLGPVEAGNYRFVFQADAPNPALIPQDDLVGVTVILLTCSYREKEFLRVGYYVATEYQEEQLRENPPEVPILDKLYRNILADKPRVTRFPIDFDAPPGSIAAQQQQQEQQLGDGATAIDGAALPPGEAVGLAEDACMVMDDGDGNVGSLGVGIVGFGGADQQQMMQQQQQQFASVVPADGGVHMMQALSVGADAMQD